MLHALLSPRIHMHYEDYGLSSILYKHDQKVRRPTKPKVDISLQNAIIPPAPRSGRYLLNPARAERQQRSVSSSGCSKVPPQESSSRRICVGCLILTKRYFIDNSRSPVGPAREYPRQSQGRPDLPNYTSAPHAPHAPHAPGCRRIRARSRSDRYAGAQG